MCQFNDQLKLLMSLYEEIHTMLEVEEGTIESDEWIDVKDEQIFNFKRRVHTWLKNSEEDRISLQSNKSHSSRGYSVKIRKSSKSNVSKRSSEEKAKRAELVAEELLLIKQQIAENKAEKLEVQQEIAKAKAISRLLETSAIKGRGLKNEQYSTEAPLIVGNSKHGKKAWDIDQSRNGERIWDIPQSRQEKSTIGMENEEIDRIVTAGQADITRMLCNLC